MFIQEKYLGIPTNKNPLHVVTEFKHVRFIGASISVSSSSVNIPPEVYPYDSLVGPFLLVVKLMLPLKNCLTNNLSSDRFSSHTWTSLQGDYACVSQPQRSPG